MSYAELTIAEYHTRLLTGTITTERLLRWYLERISRHNEAGQSLHAVVTVNDLALTAAASSDAYLAEHGRLSGPLHGVPVLVKDQAETAGMRTTFGSRLFANYVPETDATVVRRLKDAGAIVLAKTSMCDLAAGWFSSSSMNGHTRNVYDGHRDSGGSSAGSGAGTAANFGLVAIGEDTGGSIRIPAAFNNVYGFRVTTGLVSRQGFSPLVHFQDTPGPMARTVDDLARVLDAIVGYDEDDPYTAAAWPRPSGYAEAVADGPGLDAWRIGVLETGFGSDADTDAASVNRVVRAAVARLGNEGCGVVPGLVIDDLSGWIADTSVYLRQSKSDLTRFFAARPDSPVATFMDVYSSGVFHPENDLLHGIADGPDTVDDDAEYLRLRLNQERFRRLVMNLFAANEVDFLVCPTVQVLPPTHADLAAGRYTALTFPTNTVVGSQAGLPAMSIPAGFTEDGIPVGLELLGLPFSEARMLQFAAAWESVAHPRKAPAW